MGTIGLLSLAGAFALAATVAPPAGAATIKVTFHGDSADNDSNGCALREAIRAANANARVGGCKRGRAAPVVDRVKVEPGRYELTIPGEENSGLAGDLDVVSEMKIIGKGKGFTVDAGGEDGIDDRVLDVPSSGGWPRITNATLRGGNVVGGLQPNGGGIRTVTGSSLTLRDVVIANNHADVPGELAGALMADGEGAKLTDVVVKNNSANLVGGINLDSQAVLRRVTIKGNSAPYGAGGLRSEGELEIYDSTIFRNTLSSPGGGHAGGGLALVGGAISDQFAIRNSTISANRAGENGGGIALHGGSLDLLHTTIAFNRADYDAALGPGNGGGIWLDTDTQLLARSSVIALNVDASGGVPFHADCSGTMESSGYNLIRDHEGCTIGGGLDPDLPQAIDPRFRNIAKNGGKTATHALRPSSPLVDAIPRAKCTEHGVDPPRVRRDQRGVRRPQGGRCDIGAFELD